MFKTVCYADVKIGSLTFSCSRTLTFTSVCCEVDGDKVFWPEEMLAFLGAFAILRKATIIFVLSTRPSASNSSAPTGRIFMKLDIWAFLENLSRKFKFH
jgi:hypothetical protein